MWRKCTTGCSSNELTAGVAAWRRGWTPAFAFMAASMAVADSRGGAGSTVRCHPHRPVGGGRCWPRPWTSAARLDAGGWLPRGTDEGGGHAGIYNGGGKEAGEPRRGRSEEKPAGAGIRYRRLHHLGACGG